MAENLVPKANRDYLGKDVLPTLRDALDALAKALAKERRQVESGELWEDGYLPEDWQAVEPLQFLSEFFRRANPNNAHLYWTDQSGDPGSQQRSRAAAWEAEESDQYGSTLDGKLWAELTKEEKLEACFRHLDYDKSGVLDEKELRDIARTFNTSGKLLPTSAFKDSTLPKYIADMMELTVGIEPQEFDNLCQTVLGSVHLSYLSREEKLALAFAKLDGNSDGFLDLQDLEAFGGKITPGEEQSERKRRARKSMQWLDGDNDGLVSLAEFTQALIRVTKSLSDDDFDNAIQRIIDGSQSEAGPLPGPEDGLAPKFRDLVRALPGFTEVLQVAPKTLLEKPDLSMLQWLDVRSPEEQAVSLIRGAAAVPSGPLAAGEDGGEETEVATQVARAALVVGGAQVVVVYCGHGERSNIVARALRDLLETLRVEAAAAANMDLVDAPPAPQVAALCGGIIAWYNARGPVVSPEGRTVQMLHPGHKRMQGYVTRRNDFALAPPKVPPKMLGRGGSERPPVSAAPAAPQAQATPPKGGWDGSMTI